MFLSIGQLIRQHNHAHEYTEWQVTNEHPWSHVRTLYRTCKWCNKDNYKLIEILCPQFKKKGEYCYWCLPYVKYWNERLEEMEIVCDTEAMQNTKLKVNGRRQLLVRNIAIALEHDLYGKSFRELGSKYKLKNPKTVMMIYRRAQKFINQEAVREAVG